MKNRNNSFQVPICAHLTSAISSLHSSRSANERHKNLKAIGGDCGITSVVAALIIKCCLVHIRFHGTAFEPKIYVHRSPAILTLSS